MNLYLSISEIEKAYGKKKILTGCTHAFAKGVTAVMGPNGCGKSTLLRICALLERPDSGRVRYYYSRESSAAMDMDLMRRITLVLPKPGIFNTTVWNNAAFGLKLRRVGSRELKKRTREILDTVGLYDKRKQNALTLSSGEAQRLALARALVLEPEALFIDEPTASVDEENSAIIEELILDLKRKPNPPTVVIATHDRDQATRLADMVLTIRKGKIPPPSLLGLPEKSARTMQMQKGDETYINPEFFK